MIYGNAFLTGAVVMAFEMLGSRYLNPYFGSGIHTWAALISVTLLALTVGYFLGGRMVDRWPSTTLLGALVLLASLTMVAIVVPIGGFDRQMIEWDYLGETMIVAVGEMIPDDRAGVTLAAAALIFAPICLIACYSPFAVRLLRAMGLRSGTRTALQRQRPLTTHERYDAPGKRHEYVGDRRCSAQ